MDAQDVILEYSTRGKSVTITSNAMKQARSMPDQSIPVVARMPSTASVRFLVAAAIPLSRSALVGAGASFATERAEPRKLRVCGRFPSLTYIVVPIEVDRNEHRMKMDGK